MNGVDGRAGRRSQDEETPRVTGSRGLGGTTNQRNQRGRGKQNNTLAERSGSLSRDQAEALASLHAFAAGDEDAYALAGPAGSGKTFLVGRFLSETRRTVRLTATTNKAAHVAAKLAPGSEAGTIHSLLGLQPVEDHRLGRVVLRRRRDPKAKPGELVIVDEASMIDSDLLTTIQGMAGAIGFQVLFVGDAYQLPPVFESVSPAFDRVETSHLATIHRQALDNPLIATATGFRAVLDGAAFPMLAASPPGVLRADAEGFTGSMLETFASAAYRADPDHCRALAWTNKRVLELNKLIRRRLVGSDADRFPFIPGEVFVAGAAVVEGEDVILPTEGRVEIIRARGEKIAETDSGLEVNGHRVEVDHKGDRVSVFVAEDRGAVSAFVGAFAAPAQALQKRCNELRAAGKPVPRDLDTERKAAWRAFFEVKAMFSDLRPPHASTVHKSQGSTYQHAFIDAGDIGRCTHSDLIARLLYVSLTRAAQSAVLTGELPERLYAGRAAA